MARKDLPAPGAPNFLQRVREELHALLGKTGSASDRALTLREALETGVLVPGPGGTLTPGGGTGSGGTTVVEYEPDLTPPPQPGSFTATPAISHILIEQAAPFYTQGHGHGRTVVYGAQVSPALPNPVFADAVEVGRFAGTIWGMVSNPATTWRLWIKWESVDGVLSATPSGGTNGVEATTGQDPSALLEVLAGQITTAELASSLSTPIGQIPGMLADILSNADAIAQEALDRAAAITAEASARTNAMAIEASAREDADDALQQQIDLISAASSGDISALIDAVNQERDARILDVLDAENAAALASSTITSALAAEVTARGIADGALASANAITAAQAAGLSGGLAAEVSARSLADGVIASSAAVTASHASGAVAAVAAEMKIRATTDTALATTSTGLAASIGQAAAAVVSEASARATADSAQAQAQATVAAQVAQTSAAVVSLQTASASADAAQASQIASLSSSAQTSSAALQTEQTVRASQDASLAAVTTLLGANVGANAAAITAEASTRASADSAQAATTSTLGASVAGALSAIQTEEVVRASADAAQASTSTTLAASMGQATAALQVEASTRATADTAQADYQTTLAAQTAANAAAVVSVQQAFTSADMAQAGQINSIAVSTAQAAAALQVEAQVRATDDTAQATRSDAMAAQIGASASAIQTEQTARATVDAALALQTETLSVAVGANQAVIQTEITARASADAAQSSVVAVLATRTGENVAGLVTEQTARTTQDAALAQSITTTQATTGANIAAISTEQSSRTTADTALATQINVVGAATSDNAARIRTEETARATADAALAARSDSLAAASAGALASINVEQQARTTADSALATELDSVLAMTGSAAAGILTEQTARATADAALAQTSTSLQVVQAGNAAAIQAEATARTTGDTAAANQIQSIGATAAGAAAAVKAEQSARASADAAQAATSTALAASLAGNVSAIATEQTARATKDSSIAQRVDVLTAATGASSSAISAVQTASVSGDASLAAKVATLTTATGNNASAIANVSTVVSDNYATQAGQITTLQSRVSRVVNYLIRSAGSISRGSEYPGVFSETGAALTAAVRSYVLVVFNGSTGAIESAVHYDVFGNGYASEGRNAASMAAAMNALGLDKVVVVYTWDEPRDNRLTGGLPEAMYRCGASRSIFGAPDSVFKFRSAYILVGIPGIGEGAGIERYAGSVDGDPLASCEYGLQLVNGRPVGLGGNPLHAAIMRAQAAQVDGDSALAQDIETLTVAVGNKASTSYVDSVEARVDTVEGTVSSQGTLISGLSSDLSDLTGVVGTKANASALTETNTNVSNLAGTVSAQAGQITTLQSRVANASDIFAEAWDGPDPLSRWQSYDGAGEQVIVSVADGVGGKALQVGNNAGNDMRWLVHRDLIPFDPNKLYRMRVRLRRSLGSGTAYVGWVGVAADGVTLVNTSGANVYYGAHYHTAANVSPRATWTEYTGFTKGVGSGGTGALASPGKIHANVRYLRAMVLVNYNGAAGVTEIGPLVVDDGSVAEVSAAVQVEASTRATQTGELYAQYTVKTDVGGLVSGYGLASSAVNAAPTSAFGVQAGQFFVAPPAVASATAPTVGLFKGYAWRDTTANVTKYWTGGAWSTSPQALPFVVQTVPQTINGFTVEPGIYAENAFFARLVATRGQIGLLAVDDARIADLSVSKLTAGSISVGQYAQSTGYVAGSAGWRINGDGTAEFSGVVVRGTIFASQGAIGGWNIGSNYLQSTTYVLGSSGTRLNSDGTGQLSGITIGADHIQTFGFTAGTSGWKLSADGTLELNNGTFRGNIDLVGDGKFSVKTATSGARMEMSSRVIKVFDASGVLRVQIGDLTV